MTPGNFAKLTDLEMYYEIRGTGQPLVMVHGGLGTVEQFGPLLPELARSRQVIAVELQGHGHTADVDRPFSFERLSDDVAELIQHLGYPKTDVLGYSLGGGVAIQTAIRHPALVRKLVVISAPHKSDGWYPEVRAGMRSMSAEAAKAMEGSPMHQAFVRAAPRPEGWPVLAEKTGQLLRQDYDWTKAVASLAMPALLVIGDADSLSPARAAEFFALLGGGQRDAGWDGTGMPKSRLAILPATTHYNVCEAPALPGAIAEFLDAPRPESG